MNRSETLARIQGLLLSIPEKMHRGKFTGDTVKVKGVTNRIRGNYNGNTTPKRIPRVRANIKTLQGVINTLSRQKAELSKKSKETLEQVVDLMKKVYDIPPPHWESIFPDMVIEGGGGGGGGITPYVLEIAPMPTGLDINMVRHLLGVYLTPRLPFYRASKRSLYVEDEFSEWFIEQASRGKQVGKGHFAMDVRTENNDGVDVFCVIMAKTESYEKSLAQKFVEGGAGLDILFKEERFDEAVAGYRDSYSKKLEKVKTGTGLQELYYLGFVSKTDKVYLVNFKINMENIQYIGRKYTTSTGKSIYLRNFIMEKHGNVKLYMSKKRLEFRLGIDALMDTVEFDKNYEGQASAVCVYTIPPDQTAPSGEGDLEAVVKETDEGTLQEIIAEAKGPIKKSQSALSVARLALGVGIKEANHEDNEDAEENNSGGAP